MLAKINETVIFLKSKGFGKAEVGIILGTGLGNFTGEIEIIAEAGYETNAIRIILFRQIFLKFLQ